MKACEAFKQQSNRLNAPKLSCNNPANTNQNAFPKTCEKTTRCYRIVEVFILGGLERGCWCDYYDDDDSPLSIIPVSNKELTCNNNPYVVEVFNLWVSYTFHDYQIFILHPARLKKSSTFSEGCWYWMRWDKAQLMFSVKMCKNTSLVAFFFQYQYQLNSTHFVWFSRNF